MSSAFVKENEEQWLHDIAPTLAALVNYLTRENNGVRVYEQNVTVSSDGQQVHRMSNGLEYFIDDKGQWTIRW